MNGHKHPLNPPQPPHTNTKTVYLPFPSFTLKNKGLDWIESMMQNDTSKYTHLLLRY